MVHPYHWLEFNCGLIHVDLFACAGWKCCFSYHGIVWEIKHVEDSLTHMRGIHNTNFNLLIESLCMKHVSMSCLCVPPCWPLPLPSVRSILEVDIQLLEDKIVYYYHEGHRVLYVSIMNDKEKIKKLHKLITMHGMSNGNLWMIPLSCIWECFVGCNVWRKSVHANFIVLFVGHAYLFL